MHFTLDDVGCHADGAFGHQHCRERLASLLDEAFDGKGFDHLVVAGLLRGPGSDDLAEEDEAIDLLQSVTEDGLFWAFLDGDLILGREDGMWAD